MRSEGVVLCCLLLAGLCAAGGEDRRPLVGTRYGKLHGKTVTVKETDRQVHAFYGVPFAKPPVGPLRFAASGPPESWNGVREATEPPPMCLQNTEGMEMLIDLIKAKIKLPPTSEDCLYLNVFTPADRGQNAKLPVMVFIHGGGLIMGGAMMFEGSALSAHENVIIVSIQYRLGIMGFLSSGDSQAPGNYGFLDQVEALRWVQENIANFGGDPDSVTIFGESAGGVSVSALVLSPLAKGLFHRAIAESGVAILPGLVAKSAEEASFVQNIIANISGCDLASLVDCMKAKSEEEILSISAALKFVAPPATVDGVFFPKPAEQILAEKENNPVPFITGVVEQEFGWILLAALNASGLVEGMDRETVTTALLSNPLMRSLGAAVIPLLIEEYLGDETDPAEIRDRFLDLCGDFVFVMPALKTAKYHRDSGYPVYFYELRRRPSLFKDIKPDYVKADHGDELFFVIGGPFLPDDTLFSGLTEEQEKVLSKNMMKYWANFARTGDPNGPGLAEWPRYDQDEDYLQIDVHPKQKAAQRLKDTKYEFWYKILPEKIQKMAQEAAEHAGGEDGRPLVGTRYGKLLGKTVKVKDTDREVHAFYGIPFAEPPVGPLRFAASGPPKSWNGVREATKQPPMCLQNTEGMEMLIDLIKAKIKLPPTSEDCLYLNVFTPADRGQNAKLPVMVFIHGGGLIMGGAMMFEGYALSAHENVIIVSIQYRLGIMGFLSSGDSQAPGNYGFLDQVEALRWVQENIANFGGDPDCVTIFGESAGGLSVSALVLSPLAKGLFHRAIAESGVALLPGLVAKSAEETSFVRNIIANISGCDLASLVDCMKAKSEEEILSISAALKFVVPPVTVDGVFFPKPAEQISAEKENNPVPFITGVVEQEFGWILLATMNASGLVEGMDRETVTTALQSNPLMGSLGAVIPLLIEEYLGDETDPAEVRDRFLDLCGDFVFVMPALKTAKYHRDSGYPVYFYEFHRRPSLFKDIKPDYVKADHGDELFFVIGGPFLPDDTLFSGQTEEGERVLSKNIMKYWANFARTGDPNGPGLAEWPRYDQDEDYLQIDVHPKQKAAQRLKDTKYEFWNKILPEKIQKMAQEAAEHAGGEDGRPLVGTRYGKLRGKTVKVKETDREVHAFYGIPFAEPPVGPLRFAASGPPKAWNGVREATKQPPMCLQSRDMVKSMLETFRAKIAPPATSEDCLYLNIFTPADRGQDAILPVMVFIHGGAFVMGGSFLFEGVALSAHENVIVVSIQYRLGIPGFFSSGDSQAPGNYGFLDQVEALRWVKENIADFGGDRDSVTIFGESAGGMSVSALVLSPLAKGLFHRAIAESGAALVPGLFTKSAEQTIFVRNIIANISGCDVVSLVDCLKALSEEEILSISAAMHFITPPVTVDGIFLPKPAEQILAEKENNPVAFMTGVVEQECGWVLPLAMLNVSGLEEGLDRETVSSRLQSHPIMGSLGAAIPLLVEEYIGDEADPVEVRNRFLDLCGDIIFVMPALKTAKYHRDSGYPVYFYEFRRRPSLFKDTKPDFVKADHGDEVFFVIGGPFLSDDILFSGLSEEDEKVLSKNVMKYWANFARTGDPNGPGLTEWPRYDQDEDYLQIDIQPKQKAAQRPKDAKYEFWTKILPEKIQKISEEQAEHSEL